MKQAAAIKAIQDTFITQWGNRTPIYLDGEIQPAELPSSFVRLNIDAFTGGTTNSNGSELSIGDIEGRHHWGYEAIITLQIFTPRGQGIYDSNVLVDAALPIFDTHINRNTPQIRTREVYPVKIGESQERGKATGYFQQNVSAKAIIEDFH